MHFQTHSGHMNRGLSMVVRALPNRSPQPFFEGVFLETLDDGVQLTCSDGQMTIKTIIPAVVVEDGSALFPAKLFADLVKKLDGDLDIDVNRETMCATVRSEESNTSIMCMDAAEYPDIQDVLGGFEARFTQSEFQRAISKIIFARSQDETRLVLTGCYMEVFPEESRFICLDGFRFAMQKIKVSHTLPQGESQINAIFPGAIINEISRMVEDSEEEITLHVNKTHLMASFGETRVYCALIAGPYIDYRLIVPKDHTTTVRINRQALMGALERNAIIARLSDNMVRFHITDTTLSMSANSEQGSNSEKINIDFDGEPLKIAFNARYLMDVIKNVDANSMLLCFKTNVSPLMIAPTDGDAFTFLVLPVRVMDWDR